MTGRHPLSRLASDGQSMAEAVWMRLMEGEQGVMG